MHTEVWNAIFRDKLKFLPKQAFERGGGEKKNHKFIKSKGRT